MRRGHGARAPLLVGLWRHPDFMKLWSAQTVSVFGSQVTTVALALTAVLTLHANPLQVGLLRAVGAAPPLLIALFAGVWVDRLPRRPVLVWADLGRAALLGSIPCAALLGVLGMEQLYIVVFLAGVLTTVFDVSHMSFVPALVEPEQLVDGNSKLQTTFSLAYVLGPGLAGSLVALVTAPFAIAVDALSFLVSALVIGLIRVTGVTPRTPARRESMRRDIGEGLRVVFGSPVLRPLALFAGTHFFFVSAILSLLTLYASRDLGVPPALIGVVFAAIGVGYLLGALIGRRLVRRFGLGPASIGGAVLNGVAVLLIPLAGGHGIVPVALLVASQLFLGLGIMVNDVPETSLRQALTPDRLRGRVNATIRFVARGPSLFGALLGGALGQVVGLRLTLLVMGVGLLCAPLWLIFSPIPSLREPPAPVDG